MLGSLFFLIGECWRNLRRQGVMALASVTTTAIALTILGAFSALGWQIYTVLNGAPRRMEIHAFTRNETTADQSAELYNQIQAIPGVVRIDMIPRDQAWADYRAKSPDRDVFEGFNENPFPDKFVVAAATPELSLQIADRLRQMPQIDKVNDGKETLRQILTIVNVSRIIGLVLAGVLVLGTAAIIGNAIRLTLFARRREIRVMQLVGATNGFIRFPFVLEGVFEGVLGGGFACLILAGALYYYTSRVLPTVPLVREFHPLIPVPACAAILIAGGAVIGMAGSLFSLRKFLHAA